MSFSKFNYSDSNITGGRENRDLSNLDIWSIINPAEIFGRGQSRPLYERGREFPSYGCHSTDTAGSTDSSLDSNITGGRENGDLSNLDVSSIFNSTRRGQSRPLYERGREYPSYRCHSTDSSGSTDSSLQSPLSEANTTRGYPNTEEARSATEMDSFTSQNFWDQTVWSTPVSPAFGTTSSDNLNPSYGCHSTGSAGSTDSSLQSPLPEANITRGYPNTEEARSSTVMDSSTSENFWDQTLWSASVSPAFGTTFSDNLNNQDEESSLITSVLLEPYYTPRYPGSYSNVQSSIYFYKTFRENLNNELAASRSAWLKQYYTERLRDAERYSDAQSSLTVKTTAPENFKDQTITSGSSSSPSLEPYSTARYPNLYSGMFDNQTTQPCYLLCPIPPGNSTPSSSSNFPADTTTPSPVTGNHPDLYKDLLNGGTTSTTYVRSFTHTFANFKCANRSDVKFYIAKLKERHALVCEFCVKNKESKRFFTSHNLKDEYGNVTCPVLYKYVCPRCHATGRKSHTESHCPMNPNGKAAAFRHNYN